MNSSILRKFVSSTAKINFTEFFSSTTKAMASSETFWLFGYGSNMDATNLEQKKNVKVLDHTPAILKDCRLSFNLRGGHHVEPAMANIIESPGSEVHGVAFCVNKESAERMDRQEGSYSKKWAILHAYDGRQLNGYAYIIYKEPGSEELNPSSRYLELLVKGAKLAGLNQDYIAKLQKKTTYKPNEATLKFRKIRPNPEDLKEISKDELAQHRNWLSCLGYVINIEKETFVFGSHRGRDISSRMLMHFNGISMDTNDDKGQPPYLLVKDLNEKELEYLTCWLDRYTLDRDDNPSGPIIGYLKEFKNQQLSGCTTFTLPKI